MNPRRRRAHAQRCRLGYGPAEIDGWARRRRRLSPAMTPYDVRVIGTLLHYPKKPDKNRSVPRFASPTDWRTTDADELASGSSGPRGRHRITTSTTHRSLEFRVRSPSALLSPRIRDLARAVPAPAGVPDNGLGTASTSRLSPPSCPPPRASFNAALRSCRARGLSRTAAAGRCGWRTPRSAARSPALRRDGFSARLGSGRVAREIDLPHRPLGSQDGALARRSRERVPIGSREYNPALPMAPAVTLHARPLVPYHVKLACTLLQRRALSPTIWARKNHSASRRAHSPPPGKAQRVLSSRRVAKAEWRIIHSPGRAASGPRRTASVQI